jgi:hypothetical protein
MDRCFLSHTYWLWPLYWPLCLCCSITQRTLHATVVFSFCYYSWGYSVESRKVTYISCKFSAPLWKVNFSVVRLLASATNTHQLSTWIYTCLPSGGENFQRASFGIEPWFSIFLKIKKTTLSWRNRFFHANCQFFDVSEQLEPVVLWFNFFSQKTRTDSSLILKIFRELEPSVIWKSNNCTTLVKMPNLLKCNVMRNMKHRSCLSPMLNLGHH